MENCQRCLKNKPSFQCSECPSFNILCTRCDKIIHNIPSKQNHRRILLDLGISNNNNINKNLNNSENKQILLSNIDIENININKQNEENIEENIINNNIDEEKNKNINNLTQNNTEEKNTEKRNTQILTFNSNLIIKENYSKEYVNEIKKVFRKEKELLEYKNKTLQFSLDKIKLEFSDQINNITQQLEDIKIPIL